MTATAQDYADIRDSARRNMFLTAVLHCGSEQAPVTIRNMSASGALIDSPIAPPPDSSIELVRGRYVAPARIVWSEATRCGIRFTSDLSVKDWLAPIETQPVRTTIVDAAPISSAKALWTPDDRNELLEIADLVDQTTRILTADPAFLADHMTEGRNLVRAAHLLARLCNSEAMLASSIAVRANG